MVFLVYKDGEHINTLYGYNLYDKFNKNGNYKKLDIEKLKQYAVNNGVDLVEFNTRLNINSKDFYNNKTITDVLNVGGFVGVEI